jgi:hypothetical protein
MNLSDLNPSSKLWLYQSNRELNSTEIHWLNEQLAVFSEDWASHGTNLMAAAEVINPYFIAFAVDLSHANASGCSIDKSVKIVKELGKELNVDFFNRLKMWVMDEKNNTQHVSFKKINEFPDFYIYNPLVSTLGDLNTKFKLKVSDYMDELQLS